MNMDDSCGLCARCNNPYCHNCTSDPYGDHCTYCYYTMQEEKEEQDYLDEVHRRETEEEAEDA
jgi:hypothetical protein